MHAYSYAEALTSDESASFVGVWDDVPRRGKEFADKFSVACFEDQAALLNAVDAVIITSENRKHIEMAKAAAERGLAILCEKPVATTEEEIAHLANVVEGATFMTAFPCRFSPSWKRLKERVDSGEIGRIVAISATNHGTCPFGWFVDPEQSGGGSMIDHTVHVADLLRDLIGDEPVSVYAQTGSGMYGQAWEDTAMLHVAFPGGIFATIDSSWSRPASYKTWGDVKMSVVGENGVIELDMFSQGFDIYREKAGVSGYGSHLDAAMVTAFLDAVSGNKLPPISLTDGIRAAQVAIAGYESASRNEPVPFAPFGA
jgi:predicted dehydrogenase